MAVRRSPRQGIQLCWEWLLCDKYLFDLQLFVIRRLRPPNLSMLIGRSQPPNSSEAFLWLHLLHYPRHMNCLHPKVSMPRKTFSYPLIGSPNTHEARAIPFAVARWFSSRHQAPNTFSRVFRQIFPNGEIHGKLHTIDIIQCLILPLQNGRFWWPRQLVKVGWANCCFP